MSAYKFSGTIVFAGEVQHIKSAKTGNEFVKRDIAIADDPSADYPTILVGTLKKSKRTDMTNKITAQDINRKCTVSFYPEGRFYTDKVSGDRRAMCGNYITFVEFNDQVAPSVPAPADPSEEEVNQSGADDLPF